MYLVHEIVQMITSEFPVKVVEILKIRSDGFPSYHVGYIPHCLFWKYDLEYFERIFARVKGDYPLF
jgi:hypothetical protein